MTEDEYLASVKKSNIKTNSQKKKVEFKHNNDEPHMIGENISSLDNNL